MHSRAHVYHSPTQEAWGFRKLVNSLETTPPDRREKILTVMRQDDPQFVKHVEESIFQFEEFKAIGDMQIAEIVFAMKNEMAALALALFKCKDEQLLNKFTKNMVGSQAGAFRDETGILDKVTVGQQMGARFKVILKGRELQSQNRLTLKKYHPDYPDDT